MMDKEVRKAVKDAIVLAEETVINFAESSNVCENCEIPIYFEDFNEKERDAIEKFTARLIGVSKENVLNILNHLVKYNRRESNAVLGDKFIN